MNPDKRRSKKLREGSFVSIVSGSGIAFAVLWMALSNSCTMKRTDLRSLAPADTLVYVETNDLGAALQPIVDSKPFAEAAKYKPDLSALNGIQLAVAITGFEATEEKLTDEHSIGKIQPRFVAIADTHAWNFQAVGFAEAKLGAFVEKIYGGSPSVEHSDKFGGNYFTWAAKDGRKAYALVIDSLIYFGNDESTIEKCVAARSGGSDNFAKTGMSQAGPDMLASGYISPEGIAQIANIVALKQASTASDVPDVQGAIVSALPAIIRGVAGSAAWNSRRTEDGIVDEWNISTPGDIGIIFSETMAAGAAGNEPLLGHVPEDVDSVTRYNLKDSVVAWRSMLLTVQKLVGASYSPEITRFFQLIGSQYGIASPEEFLAAASPSLVTVSSNDSSAAIAKVQDADKLRSALLPDVDAGDAPAGVQGVSITGDDDLVQRCIATGGSSSFATDERFSGPASVMTLGRDHDLPRQIAELLAEPSERPTVASSFATTRFTPNGIVRTTTSDLGFIGWIVAQLADD